PATVTVPARGAVDVAVHVRDTRTDGGDRELTGTAGLAEDTAGAISFTLHLSAPPPAPVPSPLAVETAAPGSALPSGMALTAAGTAAVGTIAAAIWAARRRWPWLFAALYTRLAPNK